MPRLSYLFAILLELHVGPVFAQELQLPCTVAPQQQPRGAPERESTQNNGGASTTRDYESGAL